MIALKTAPQRSLILIPNALMESRDRWLPALLVLIALAVVEVMSFAAAIKGSGFYLDDWRMMWQLHFGPQTFFDATCNLLVQDPRVSLRPVQAPYYAGLYLLFGANPLGYHVVNAVLEIFCAWAVFLALTKFTGNRFLSAIASLVFLLYPAHDSTHYWVLASSITLSFLLYTISLWLSIKGVLEGAWRFHILAAVAFALSIFNYESFLPLAAVNVACVYYLSWRNRPPRAATVAAALSAAPYVLAVAGLWYYQQELPNLSRIPWHYEVKYDSQCMATAIIEGIRASCSPYALSFFWSQASQTLAEHLQPVPLVVVCLTAVVLLYFLSRWGKLGAGAGTLILLGVLAIVSSYTIFGLNPNYVPRIDTALNRLNTGASFGISMVIAGLLGYLLRMFWWISRIRLRQVLFCACFLCPLLLLFMLANQGFSRPWIVSNEVQRHIVDVVRKERGRLSESGSVILANCPRYVMWSPLFDGVWDFEAMVRLVLQKRDFPAGVVSERMQMSATDVKDIAYRAVCGVYPFKQMIVLVASTGECIPVQNSRQFVQTIRQYGMSFGLEPKTLSRWEKEMQESR